MDVVDAAQRLARARLDLAANGAYWAFLSLLVVQVVHMLEHTAQVHQYFLGNPEGRGFFGAWFDFVWVHFAFNVGVFLLILAAWLMWKAYPSGWQTSRRGARWFAALLVFQGYHAAEHVVQAIQYYAYGMASPPGVIGRFLPNVIAHFDLNLVLLMLLATVAVTLRPRRMQTVAVDGPIAEGT